MKPRFLLELPEPATGFTESFLLGNGQLGASVQGGIGAESFALNLDTLWSGGPLGDEPGPSPAHLLDDLRAAIRRGDGQLADSISRDIQGPGWTQSYQPLGTVRLRYAASQAAGSYRRTLDLAKAEARVEYVGEGGPVTTRALVSAPAQVLLVTVDGRGALAARDMALSFETPQLDAAVRSFAKDGIQWLVVSGRVPANVLPNYVEREPAVVYGQDAPDADGSVAAGMGYAVVAALHRDAEGQARMIVAAESGFRAFDTRPSADVAALADVATRRVKAVLTQDTQSIVDDHRADYSSYFDRMDLDLSGSVVHDGRDPHRAELLYHYGRYLMISGSRPGTQPTNLQGIWNIDVRPAWSCNYTVNINTEMNYWPAEIVDLGELAGPLHTFVADAAGERGKTAARHYYGARGACVHHNTDIWHFSAPVNGDPHWANWPSGLIWLSLQLRNHIEFYPEDHAFIATVALPAWREAVSFALDLLVEHEDGSLVASPSTSPENMFLADGGYKASVSAGTAMDQEMIRELLELYISFADEADRNLVDEALAALVRLRLPVLTADGALAEWSRDVTPVEIGHRHFSHLYGLHPGRRITEEGPADAFAGVRKALDTRLAHGSGHTGWSQAWVLCQAARLRDPALADKAIHGLLNDLAFKSLMVLHPHSGWAEGSVFQIDGNFGAVAGMSELVVQSREGRIIILPTLPASWQAGVVRGIRTIGGHRVDLSWSDGKIEAGTITAGTDGAISLEYPVRQALSVKAGQADVTILPSATALVDRALVRWEASAGTRYELSFS